MQFLSTAWPKDTGAPVNSSPVLGDLDGDGILEIVVGADNNKVYAWKPDGTLMPGWPVTTGDSVRSSPALADIDGDGRLDVIVGSFDNKVYAWNFNGSLLPGWPAVTGSVVYSSPAVGDIDGDQLPEVIVGSFDNKVYAWNADGTLVRGWPKPTGLFVYSSPALADIDHDGLPEVIVGTDNNRVFAWNGDGTDVEGWPTATEHVVPSSPAVGDIDNDGTYEVVVGSWDKVFVWNSQGERKTGWPVTAAHQIPSSPALADLNNDGRLEIIIGCKDGRVYAWDSRGQILPGWPAVTDAEISATPAVADLNGDGRLEVIIGSKDQKVYIWDAEGRLYPGWPKKTGGAISSSPAVADIDQDGTLEVVIGSKDQKIYVWSFPRTGALPPRIVWQNFHGDPSHSGLYGMQASITVASQPIRPIEPRVIPAAPEVVEQFPVVSHMPQQPGHNIQQPIVPREIVEGYISDLVISDYNAASVTVTWTTPPGVYSPQARYDIRYSPQPITEDSWQTALRYPQTFPPAPPGSREVQELSGIKTPENRPFNMLYLAVKVVDGTRRFPLSNVVRFERQDSEPPSRIANLAVTELNETLIELSWNASGDDGLMGTAANYDIRYAEIPLNDVTWVRATQLENEPAPLPSGTEQHFQTPKPWNDREIYWGIKVIDESLNISELSEVAVWSPRDDIPPSRIVDLRVTKMTGDAATLSWTAPGNNRNIGKAIKYDIRSSAYPITNESEWMAASPVADPPLPAEAGSIQSYELRGIPFGEIVFVGIKALDRSGNLSALSNVVETAMDDMTPPAAVSDLKIERVGKDWTQLSWSASGDDGQQGKASAYVIRYGGNFQVVNAWNSAIDVQEVPTPSMAGARETLTIRGLNENSTYYVGLRVLDEQGNSSDSSTILRVKTLGHSTPEAVTDLIIEELRPDGVTLNWTAPQDFGEETITVSGYEMRYALEEISEDTWEQAVKLAKTQQPSTPKTLETFTLTNGPRDTRYYVALKAFDALGNMSAISNVIEVPEIDSVSPDPILDLFVEDSGADWIKLSWTATGDDGQQGQAAQVQIRLSSKFSQLKQWDHATEVPNTVQPSASGMKDTFTISNLPPDATFYLALKSRDDFGNISQMSNIVRAKTKDAIPPQAIRDLRTVRVDKNGIVLEWTAPGEDGMQGQAGAYDLRFSQEPLSSINWENVQTVSLVPRPAPAGSHETVNILEPGLLPNTQYYFAIISVDAGGNRSPLSNVVSVVTLDTIAPEPIRTLVAENIDQHSALLRWVSPGDDELHDTPSGYEIRYARSALTETSWSNARLAEGSPLPSPQGESERFLLSGLQPNSLYYIGVKAFDENGNSSELSNTVQLYTASDIVKDLQILEFSGQSVTLGWTAPGGVLSGEQRSYDIRYATSPITDANWESAKKIETLRPADIRVAQPGQSEQVELTGLPRYEQMFFALRILQPVVESDMLISEMSTPVSNVVELNRLDVVPPAAVTTLRLKDLGDISPGMRSLEIEWQSPGDNELDGTATKYELRYGTVPPTAENWPSLSVIAELPLPLSAGALQRATAEISYGEDNLYFALRTFDEALNVSELSNIAQWAPDDSIPPAAVSDLQAERLPNGDVRVMWTAPGDNAARGIAALYDIRYATGESHLKHWQKASVVPGEPLPEVAGTPQEYIISGLDPDKTYYVAMKTVDDAKNISALSNFAAVSKVLPQRVDNLAFLESSDTTVTLVWTMPSENAPGTRVVKYDIRYAEKKEQLEDWNKAKRVSYDFAPGAPGASESIVIEKLTPQTTYYFALRSIEQKGERSEISNIVEASTVNLILPGRIEDLASAGGSETSVTLSWTAPGDRRSGGRVVRYEIRYAEDRKTLEQWNRAKKVSHSLVPQQPGETEAITLEKLLPNSRYYVAIKSLDHRGETSTISNIAVAYTTDTIPPQPVVDLTVRHKTENSVTLTWTVQPDDALHETPELYDVRYSLQAINESNWGTAMPVEIPDLTISPTSPMMLTISGLEENTPYYFAVRAIDGNGNISAFSNPTVVRTSDVTAPQGVADLQAMFPTTNSVMLVWTCPADSGGMRTLAERDPAELDVPSEDTLIGAYDLRYQEVPIDGTPLNEDSWETATQVITPPKPLTPGTVQEFIVEQLEPGKAYAFAIKAIDRSKNRSFLSNVVLETTLPVELEALAQTRALDSPGWQVVQGEALGNVQHDDLGIMTMQTNAASRSLSVPPAITAVYPQGNQRLSLRQGELALNVKTTQNFLICAKVMASSDGEAPYTLCYTPSEYLMRQAQTEGDDAPAERPRKRIGPYVYYAIDPELLDNKWHELRLHLAKDLRAGTGLDYQDAVRFSVRGADVSFRDISMQGEVFSLVDDFEQGVHPLESGWKLHFGSGLIQLIQDAVQTAQANTMVRVIPKGKQPNTFLYAKSDTEQALVLTYPRDGSARLSDKPIFAAQVKTSGNFKIILKVSTKDQREYYVAYVPEAELQHVTSSSGNYLYLPLYTSPLSGRADWTAVRAHLAEDLRAHQLEYDHTSWISFHGKDFSLDEVGFSTERLDTDLK